MKIINKIEKEVRKNLNLNIYDIYDNDSPTDEEMAKLKAISDELKVFEQYYE